MDPLAHDSGDVRDVDPGRRPPVGADQARVADEGRAGYDDFGTYVALTGDTVVVGAYRDDDKGSDSGSAYVFIKPPAGWSSTLKQTAKLMASDGAGRDYFGVSVAASGNTVLAGAQYGDGVVTDSGSVYRYGLVQLAGSGTPSPGGTVSLGLTAILDPGLPYQLASSLGTGPIYIDTRQIGLTMDWMFVVTVWNAFPTIFSNYAGTIDARGAAKASISIPNDAGLVGYTIHTAFVTLNTSSPSGIQSVSNTYSLKITK